MIADEAKTKPNFDNTMQLRVPVAAVRLSSIRAVAADLAMHEDFDLDSVSDLRLAVDEACSILVGLATPQAQLECRFAIADDTIAVRASVHAGPEARVEQSGFAWQVLSTLTDSVRVEHDAGVIAVELSKRNPTS